MRAVSSSSIAAAPHVPARLFCCEIRARRVTYSYSVHPSTSIIGMSALGAGLPSFVGEERLGLRPEKVCTIFRGVPVHICSTAGKRPADKRFSVCKLKLVIKCTPHAHGFARYEGSPAGAP